METVGKMKRGTAAGEMGSMPTNLINLDTNTRCKNNS